MESVKRQEREDVPVEGNFIWFEKDCAFAFAVHPNIYWYIFKSYSGSTVFIIVTTRVYAFAARGIVPIVSLLNSPASPIPELGSLRPLNCRPLSLLPRTCPFLIDSHGLHRRSLVHVYTRRLVVGDRNVDSWVTILSASARPPDWHETYRRA